MDYGEETFSGSGLADGRGSPACLTVMYHYVRKRDPLMSDGIIGLSPREFETQLDQLCQALEPIDWPTLLAWTEGRGVIPQRCFLLTFDDGLADHAKVVLPILQRRGLRGVFFVSTDPLTRRGMLAAHAIHLLLATLGQDTFEGELLRFLKEDGRSARGSSATGGGRYVDWLTILDTAAAEAMYHYEAPQRARVKYLLTMVLPLHLRQQAVGALFEKHIGSSRRWAQHWYLGWDELTDMQSLGHTIGGHGQSHEPLVRLTPTERRHDLQQASAVLNEGLGHDRRPLSYPYGCLDADTCSACRDAGFVHAFTTERRWIRAAADPLRLPRFDTVFVEAELRKEPTWAVASRNQR